MADVVALGEMLIDFTFKNVDKLGYPTLEAIPGERRRTFLQRWRSSVRRQQCYQK